MNTKFSRTLLTIAVLFLWLSACGTPQQINAQDCTFEFTAMDNRGYYTRAIDWEAKIVCYYIISGYQSGGVAMACMPLSNTSLEKP